MRIKLIASLLVLCLAFFIGYAQAACLGEHTASQQEKTKMICEKTADMAGSSTGCPAKMEAKPVCSSKGIAYFSAASSCAKCLKSFKVSSPEDFFAALEACGPQCPG